MLPGEATYPLPIRRKAWSFREGLAEPLIDELMEACRGSRRDSPRAYAGQDGCAYLRR